MQVIFRVETPEGFGPFIGGPENWKIKMTESHGDYWDIDQHPIPDNDSLPNTESNYNFKEENCAFGFVSRKQLMQWFTTTHREFLKEDGYHIAVYVVDKEDVSYNDKQAFFVKKNAELFETLDILTFEIQDKT